MKILSSDYNRALCSFIWIVMFMITLTGCGPEPYCDSHPCPDLEVRVLSISPTIIKVQVSNIGELPTRATTEV